MKRYRTPRAVLRAYVTAHERRHYAPTPLSRPDPSLPPSHDSSADDEYLLLCSLVRGIDPRVIDAIRHIELDWLGHEPYSQDVIALESGAQIEIKGSRARAPKWQDAARRMGIETYDLIRAVIDAYRLIQERLDRVQR